MSRNSSVAVLADCTDLYNSHASLIGLNGPSSVLSIENETILTNNTDISPSEVIGSVSFQERVRSTDLAALFPRGSLNQTFKKKKKEKKKNSESFLSTSQSSENISSLQSNTNVTLSDENVSASFEECSENKEEGSSKPFNKRLYLKKKSVNISFDSGSLNDSIPEKTLKRNSRAVNVTLDQLHFRGKDETDESVSDSFEGSKKFGNEKESAKIFKKRYIRKKSVDISFNSSSLNNSVAEKSIDDSPINNVSLQSKRKIALRSHKLKSVLNIDNLKSAESSEENSTSKETKSNKKCINISYSQQTNEENNESELTSTEGNSSEENASKHDKVNDSLKDIDDNSEKVFNKKLYLKKKSINISFDTSSVSDPVIENNRVSDVSLDPFTSKIANITESTKFLPVSFQDSQQIEIKEEPTNAFNKNLYLKKKSLHISFDTSSVDGTITEIVKENNQIDNISLEPSSSKITNVTESEENLSKELRDLKNGNGTINHITNEKLNSTSLVISNSPEIHNIEEKQNSETKNGNISNILISDSLKAIEEEKICSIGNSNNISCQINEVSKENQPITPEEDIFNENTSKGNTTIDDNYSNLTKNDEHIPDGSNSHINSVDINLEPNDIILSKNLAKKTSKDENTEVIDFRNSNNAVSGNNESKSCEIDNVVITDAEKNKSITESEIETNISTNDSLKTINEELAKVFNKNFNLKKSINISLDSHSLNDSTVEKSNTTDLAEYASATLEGSQKIKNEEESAKLFNKNLYLKKKSINISFDSSSINGCDTVSEKVIEGNNEVTDGYVNSLTSKITNITESTENGSAPFEGSQKLEIEEPSTKVFNKNLYLKKKSINISFDSSSINDSDTFSEANNKEVTDGCVNSLMSKITNITELTKDASAPFEGSQKPEIEEPSTKVFNKDLYLKKKSINISFDSSSINDIIPEKGLDENNQVAEISSDLLSFKTINDIDSVKCIAASLEGSEKMETEKESAVVFNKNEYLKKKSINISFDTSTMSDPIIIEKNGQVGDISLNPLSSKSTDLAEPVSTLFEASQIMETKAESAIIFNKNLYLKKKSINISFDTSSVTDPIPEDRCEGNSQDVDISSDPLSYKITNVTESTEGVSASLEGSRKIESDKESAKVFNKNLYLKKKSINVSFDSSDCDPIREKGIEENSRVAEISSDPLSYKITSDTEATEDVPTAMEVSQKMEIEDPSAKVFNKNLYLKKKSINISFDSSMSSDCDPIREKGVEENSLVAEVSSDPLSYKITSDTESTENVPASMEVSQKVEIDDPSTKVFNKKLYLKKKSINISFDSSSLNDPIPKKNLEENSEVCDMSLNPLSSKITNVTESAECGSASFEEAQEMETKEESAKIFNKNLYLKKKSINISFDTSSINEPIIEKGLEGNSQVADFSSDPSSFKITNVTESAEDVITSLKGSQKMEAAEESAKIFNKNLYLKKQSINISFEPSSIIDSEPVSGKELKGNSEVSDDCFCSVKSKIINDTESTENASAPFEGSQKLEIEEPSTEAFNKNLYLKKKSINMSFDLSSINSVISEKRLERNNQIANVSSDPLSYKIINEAESTERISGSLKGSRELEIEEERKNMVSSVSQDLKVLQNTSHNTNHLSNDNGNASYIAIIANPSKINNVTIIDEGTENSSTENDTYTKKAFKQDFSEGNSSSRKAESIPGSNNISYSQINEVPKESPLKSPEGNSCSHVITSKGNNTIEDNHSTMADNSEHLPVRESSFNSVSNNPELNDVSLSKDENIEVIDIQNSSGAVNANSISKYSEMVNVAIIDEEKNKAIFENVMHSKIATNDSLNIMNLKDVEQDCSEGIKGKSFPNSIITCSEINEEANTIISENHSRITNNNVLLPHHESSSGLNSVDRDLEPDDKIISQNQVKNNSKDENTEEIYLQNSNDVVNGNDINKSSEINSVTVFNEKNKSTTESETHKQILIDSSSNVITERAIVKDCEENLKSISTSTEIPCSQIDEESNELKLYLAEENSIEEVASQDSQPNTEKHSSVMENIEQCSGHVLISPLVPEGNDQELDNEAVLSKSLKSGSSSPKIKNNINSIMKKQNVIDANNLSKSNSSAIFDKENNTSETASDIQTNILTNDLLKAKDVEEDCSAGKNDEENKEGQPISLEENCLNENTSKDNKKINSEGSDQGQVEETVGSKSFKSKKYSSTALNRNSIKKSQREELIDIQNNSENVNEHFRVSTRRYSKRRSSKIDKAVVEDEKNISATNDPSKVVSKRSIVQDNSEENHSSSKRVKSISTSINIACQNKESIESPPKLADSSKAIKVVEDNNSITDNIGHRTDHMSKRNLDMRMSVGLSVICKDNERMPETRTVKNICHSTPLVKYQKNKITSKKPSLPEEVKTDSKKVFACPDVPARNLRERSINNKSLNISKRSRKNDKNCSDNLENSAKKNKSSTSGNGTEDFIEDISIIPNPKPFSHSRVMYHSTPISKAFGKKNKSKLKGASNVIIEDKNIQQDDKMIQVSKSIFGSTTEETNGTVSKKKSIEFSNNCSSRNEKSENRTKRKSDLLHTEIKKLPRMESISESRSYHSNFISTFEDDVSYCTTRKSMKRVAFKSLSSLESSTSGYGNSSDDYAPINRKSVGFRDAISLIEDTIGNSSEGDIRDAINSNSSIVNPNSIGIHDTPVNEPPVNESKNRIDRNELSLNYSAEVPEIILTENEIECNEMSKECSLFNKLIKMAEKKKSGGNMTTRQSKTSKGRKKSGSSKSVASLAKSDIPHLEKWVSPNLIKFLNGKLMTDALDHVINTDRIVSILCSAVSAVRNLQDVNDIDFALLPLKNILLKFRVCCNMIEYCTFISRFTPFEFQRKALPLEGYFGSCKRGIKKKLTDPILTETEKMNVFLN
ncbi:unnamed protein product [Nezara viridula]|uniref:Uncharacterized protein n=1 Tax=Nezara viridula TaxID=85310 RepID=A0A9P0MK53_NEZVI|nr:unnamed protein product [Nezara viridula]